MISLGSHFRQLQHLRFLFDDENADRNLVQLYYSSPSVVVEIVFQTKENGTYGLAPHRTSGFHHYRVASIYSPLRQLPFREKWLAYRGSNVGRAIEVDGVVEVPPFF